MSSTSRNEVSWINYGLIALGAVASIIGVGSWLGARFDVLLGFLAGAGWALFVAILVAASRHEKEIDRLVTEIDDLRRQTTEWRAIATNDSDSLNTLVKRALPLPKIRARTATPNQNQNEGNP